MDAAPIPVETLLAHREWVRAVARAVVRDPNAADDVEQETWLAAISSPPRSESSLRGWLGAVVRSRARRSGRTDARRATRETAAARIDATQSAAELAEIADTHRRVVQAVVELAEPYRQTILLRYFEGLAVEDVAARMGVPLDTTRSRISRGLAKLRERLSRELGTDERPLGLALMPLIGGTREPAAGAGVGAAAGGGVIVATKAAWALGAVLVVVGLGAFAATKWTASADDSKGVAAAPAPLPAPAAAQDDGTGKPPAPPAPRPASPETPKPAAPSETASQKLDRTMIDASWNDTPLLEILGDLSAKADIDFFIAAEALAALGPNPDAARVSMEMSNANANAVVHVVADIRQLSIVVEAARVIVLPGDGKRDESKPLVPIARGGQGAKKTLIVKGVVVDEQGAPVAHADVVTTCGEPPVAAESGVDGAFSFETGRPFGVVFAKAPGHVASWVFPVDGKYGDTVEVRLALRGPGAAVEGVVREADGREVVGATVTVTSADPAGGGTPPKGARAPGPTFVKTGADGRYRADCLAPGGFEVAVRQLPGPTANAKGTANPGETVQADVRLPATTTWRGVLRDADGKPVAGAIIQTGGHGPARTASDGTFALVGLEPGAVQVRVRTRDGATVQKQVDVEKGADFRFDLFVGGGPRIAGRVVDEDGSPIADCNVELNARAAWLPEPQAMRTTGADGRFAFDELEPGSYRVAVWRRSRTPLVVSPETATGSADVEIRVPRQALSTSTLRARIVDADGKPVAESLLFARDVETGRVAFRMADGLGTLTLGGLSRGRYLLWAGDANDWMEIGTRALDAGADVDLGTVRFDREHVVKLHWDVVGDVAKASTNLSWWRLLSDGSRTKSANAADRGTPTSWELKLTAGRHVLRLTGDGVQPFERTIDVGATGDAAVVLPFRAAPVRRIVPRFAGDAPRFARVRVLDADGVVVESTFSGAPIAVSLVPGPYRVEADVAVATIETLHGEFDVPAEKAPDRFDVVLR